MVLNLMGLQSIKKKTLKIIQDDMCFIHRCYVLGT